MSIIFDQPNADPRDRGGWGYWLNSHMLEHQQFIEKAQSGGTFVDLSLYDIGLWLPTGDRGWWISSHLEMHQGLELATGLPAPQLDDVDFDKPESWGIFLDLNAEHHAAIRDFYGIT